MNTSCVSLRSSPIMSVTRTSMSANTTRVSRNRNGSVPICNNGITINSENVSARSGRTSTASRKNFYKDMTVRLTEDQHSGIRTSTISKKKPKLLSKSNRRKTIFSTFFQNAQNDSSRSAGSSAGTGSTFEEPTLSTMMMFPTCQSDNSHSQDNPFSSPLDFDLCAMCVVFST